MDGLKNAETSSMDFYTQLVTLKGWKKQFENLWADFWEKRKIWFRKSKPKIHYDSKDSHGIFDLPALGFMVTLKSLINEYTRLDNSIFFPSYSDIFLHTLLKFWKKSFILVY